MASTWSTADTVATIAAGAQVSAAIFTGVMARRTHGLATQTERMAAETKRVADATDLQARATETRVAEAQLDRELSLCPYLTRTVITSTINTSGTLGSRLGYSETITARGRTTTGARFGIPVWPEARRYPGFLQGLATAIFLGSCCSHRRMIRIRRNSLTARSSARMCSATGSACRSGEEGAICRARKTRRVQPGRNRA